MNNLAFVIVMGTLIVVLAGFGRGSGATGQPTAVKFFADDGSTCYAIRNSADEVVGGSCR